MAKPLFACVLATLVTAAPAAASSLYAALTTPDRVVQYRIGPGGLLSPGSQQPTGSGPSGIAISPDAASLYVANGAGSVSQYTLSVTGDISPKSPPSVPAVGSPAGIAVSPDGRSLYATGGPAGVISQFDIASDGRLTSKPAATVPAGPNPVGVAVRPDGGSLYVVDGFLAPSGGIRQYDIGPGGAATPKPVPTAAPGAFRWIAISPDGRSLYVPESELIAQYNIADDGQITPKSPSGTRATAPDPTSIAISPDGVGLYVSFDLAPAPSLAQFDIAAGGVLFRKAPVNVIAGTGGTSIVMTPDGGSAYLAASRSNTIWQYSFGVGGLSPKDPATIDAYSAAAALAVTPDRAPKPSLTARTATAGSDTQFDGGASVDPDGSIARFDWSFGDGFVALNAGPRPAHRYPHPGRYTASLTVTDNIGCGARLVYTGQTAYCNGGPGATTTRVIEVKAFGGARLKSRSVRVKHGAVRVRLECPASTAGSCAGTLSLSKISGRRTSFGRAGFSLQAGKTLSLKVRLSKVARKLLAKRARLKAKVTIKARDAVSISKTNRSFVILTAKKKRANRAG